MSTAYLRRLAALFLLITTSTMPLAAGEDKKWSLRNLFCCGFKNTRPTTVAIQVQPKPPVKHLEDRLLYAPAVLIEIYTDTTDSNMYFYNPMASDRKLFSLYASTEDRRLPLYVRYHTTENSWGAISSSGRKIRPIPQQDFLLTLTPITSHRFLRNINKLLRTIDNRLEELIKSGTAKPTIILHHNESNTSRVITRGSGALVYETRNNLGNKVQKHLMIYLIKQLIHLQHKNSLNLETLFSLKTEA